MDELILDKTYKKGDSGPYVRLIQEWICFNGIGLVIDGNFGPATRSAVRKFQMINTLSVDGKVGPITFSKLIESLSEAIKPISSQSISLRENVVAYALQHYKARPRELGGQNKGPWVRYYMRGNEGADWPWCAGFVSTIVTQACNTLQVANPYKLSESCDEMASNAKAKRLFISENEVSADRSVLKPGFLFLNRASDNDWSHTGIVIAVERDVFHTIEGNTNDEGSAEGYEVCQRIRNYVSKDFIRI